MERHGHRSRWGHAADATYYCADTLVNDRQRARQAAGANLDQRHQLVLVDVSWYHQLVSIRCQRRTCTQTQLKTNLILFI